jgi:ABC-2 type transport system permease protein
MTDFGARRAIWLIARREITTRVRSKAFVISTGLMLVGIAGYIVLMNVIGSSVSHATVGFTPRSAPLAAPLASAGKAVGLDITEKTVPDQATGEAQVRGGRLDALVTGDPQNFRVEVKKSLSGNLRTAFTVLARQVALNAELSRVHADPAAVSGAVDGATVHTRALQPGSQYQTVRLALGIVVSVLLYMSVLINGQAVAQGVIEEKSSRVVELLLSTVRPWQLMAGKVLGIAVVGMVQVLVLAGVGLAAGLATAVLAVPTSVAAGTVLWGLVWYLLGFFTYALLFAAAGALVSRQEDAGAVQGPVMMLIIVPFIIGISVLPANPDSSLAGTLSVVPVFAPMLMPMRLALGVATGWQVALALLLTVALIAGLVWLCGRIYGNAVLRTGARVRLRDALRAA